MASQPDLHLPIEAQGTLRLEAPTGRSFELKADGARVSAELPGWSELHSAVPRSFRARTRLIRTFAKLLSINGLTMSLQTNGRPVFELGCGTKPNWLSRLLGLAPAYVSLSVFRLIFKRA